MLPLVALGKRPLPGYKIVEQTIELDTLDQDMV